MGVMIIIVMDFSGPIESESALKYISSCDEVTHINKPLPKASYRNNLCEQVLYSAFAFVAYDFWLPLQVKSYLDSTTKMFADSFAKLRTKSQSSAALTTRTWVTHH